MQKDSHKKNIWFEALPHTYTYIYIWVEALPQTQLSAPNSQLLPALLIAQAADQHPVVIHPMHGVAAIPDHICG